MKMCDNCIHQKVCWDWCAGFGTEAEVCEHYHDKSIFVKFPCNVGDYVFDISDGTVYETRVLQFVYTDHLTIRTVSSFPDASEIGKRIFLTKEEAEKALMERETK